MKPIDEYWTGFNAMVVPHDACDAQRDSMRIAFYGGAKAAYSLLAALADKDEEMLVHALLLIGAEMEGFEAELSARCGRVLQ